MGALFVLLWDVFSFTEGQCIFYSGQRWCPRSNDHQRSSANRTETSDSIGRAEYHRWNRSFFWGSTGLSILSWKKAKTAGNEKISGRYHIFVACGDKIGSIYPHCQLWANATTRTKIFAPTDAASGQVKTFAVPRAFCFHIIVNSKMILLPWGLASIARGATSIQRWRESGMKAPERKWIGGKSEINQEDTWRRRRRGIIHDPNY